MYLCVIICGKEAIWMGYDRVVFNTKGRLLFRLGGVDVVT